MEAEKNIAIANALGDGAVQVSARTPISTPAASLVCGAVSARIRSIRGCPPLQTIADGYASVAYVNNDHPAHFGDTYLVIIDIKWRKSSHPID